MNRLKDSHSKVIEAKKEVREERGLYKDSKKWLRQSLIAQVRNPGNPSNRHQVIIDRENSNMLLADLQSAKRTLKAAKKERRKSAFKLVSPKR